MTATAESGPTLGLAENRLAKRGAAMWRFVRLQPLGTFGIIIIVLVLIGALFAPYLWTSDPELFRAGLPAGTERRLLAGDQPQGPGPLVTRGLRGASIADDRHRSGGHLDGYRDLPGPGGRLCQGSRRRRHLPPDRDSHCRPRFALAHPLHHGRGPEHHDADVRDCLHDHTPDDAGATRERYSGGSLDVFRVGPRRGRFEHADHVPAHPAQLNAARDREREHHRSGGDPRGGGPDLLGLGLEPGTPSWGVDLGPNARSHFASGWWLPVFPGVALSLTVLAFNFVGDSLRDVLDPRLRGSGLI